MEFCDELKELKQSNYRFSFFCKNIEKVTTYRNLMSLSSKSNYIIEAPGDTTLCMIQTPKDRATSLQGTTNLGQSGHENRLVGDFQVPEFLVPLEDLEREPGVGRDGVVKEINLKKPH